MKPWKRERNANTPERRASKAATARVKERTLALTPEEWAKWQRKEAAGRRWAQGFIELWTHLRGVK